MRLKDKVAIITGAASGIGKEIAIVFARERSYSFRRQSFCADWYFTTPLLHLDPVL